MAQSSMSKSSRSTVGKDRAVRQDVGVCAGANAVVVPSYV